MPAERERWVGGGKGGPSWGRGAAPSLQPPDLLSLFQCPLHCTEKQNHGQTKITRNRLRRVFKVQILRQTSAEGPASLPSFFLNTYQVTVLDKQNKTKQKI